MLPIGTAFGSASRQTQQVQHTLDSVDKASLRLATMQRINRGSDDPAGLIAAAQLNRELTALEEASAATERTRALVQVADSGLGQASDLLNQIEGNLVAAANGAFSPAERAAIQIEIDAAIDAIDRIGISTTFAGERIFTGESAEVLAGPHLSDRASLTLPELTAATIGGESGKLNDVRSDGSASISNGDAESAGAVTEQARQQLVFARAELGAFERTTLDATQRLFQETSVKLSAGLSRIADADVALESANLVKAITLADSAVATARLTVVTQRVTASLFSELLDAIG